MTPGWIRVCRLGGLLIAIGITFWFGMPPSIDTTILLVLVFIYLDMPYQK